MSKALYIVVRHPRNPNQKYKNVWLDDDRIQSITTTPTVAKQCREESVVCVHRCGWKDIKPIIACSVKVKSIEGPSESPVVRFMEPRIVKGERPKRIYGGINSYYDEAPE